MARARLYARWNLNDLPIVPEKWRLQPRPSVTKQLNVIKRFLHEASEVVHAGDPDTLHAESA